MRRILAIDGGGIKGVFPAAFLAAIEESVGLESVAEYFDLIVGTSTGGIIALGLGLGVSARRILAFYEEHGPARAAEPVDISRACSHTSGCRKNHLRYSAFTRDLSRP
jgi:patatin-like phospholipase/acyl hydrolase